MQRCPCRSRCMLQAQQQALQQSVEQWTRSLEACLRCPRLACCPDFERVHQRLLASFKARAALFQGWVRLSAEYLKALQAGQLLPPAPLPRLELQLPAGVSQEVPPSIDRCTACQDKLDTVSRGAAWVAPEAG